MRIGLPILCVVALASTATAQSPTAPFPGGVNINGGWVPCDHPIAINAGKGCVANTPTPPVPPRPRTPDCPTGQLNLYLRLVCDPPRTKPRNPWTNETFSFEVGGRYRLTYPNDERLIVTSIELEPSTLRRIITGRRFPEDGLAGTNPVVFYEDNEVSWVPLEPGQTF